MRAPADRAGRWFAFVLAAALSSGSCGRASLSTGDADPAAPSEEERLREELRRFEQERRRTANFATAPASDRLLGADPYAIRPLARDRFLGILRGVGAVVLLDAELHEIARAEAPPSPSGLALEGDRAFVVGERSSEIRTYRVERDRIEARGAIALDGARALRDVAAGPNGVLYVVEEDEGRLFTLVPSARAPGGYEISVTRVGAGALRVARTPGAVVVLCLLAHTVAAYRVDARGVPVGSPAVIANDGPLWSFSAIDDADGLVIASGGVENRPLDRLHGSFENIDSFVYLDRVAWGSEPQVMRLAEVNVSEHGVIVPKAIDLRREEGGFSILATGYGGDRLAEISLREAPGMKPEVVAHPLPPGTNALARTVDGLTVIANPLLDAWLLYRTERSAPLTVHVAGPGDAERSAASRLGEALIFTTLIAPWNRADGPLSRFTCETCHFEGYGDGRTHATGRGDVRATTKPLLGLFNNRPHFSRALDPDLASVARNEFRVAGARSDHSPVFDLKVEDRTWLADLGVTDADLTAVALRRAFMTFLMSWSHRPSSISAGRTSFTDDERRGAAMFRDHCESCHEALLATDAPESRVPFEAWEKSVLSEAAPIVWAQPKYAKTGILPYVHDDGARVPSLRRLTKKHPYFTNGSAKSLADVLARVRFGGGAFSHNGASAEPSLRALSDDERAAMAAFLRLL
jgi:hypothetical protein